jgi:teichoic acid transport system permease protein
MGGSVSGYPFFLWLIAGVVPWFYMSDMITQGAGAIRKYSYLVTKMKFPVSTIPTFVNISKFVIHIILMLIVIIIFWLFGYPPSIYYLQLPFYMILMFIFFDAWSLFASLLASISKDFLNLVKAFVSAVFWLSGIIWDANSVTIPWLKKFLNLNPVTFFVNGFRNCFINQVWFWEQPKRFLYLGISFAIILVLALWAYKKLRKEIPDVL